ncbi:hypothetical protein PPERSA_09786 [Pseudocohnilembus persalinus]|uniref:Uncharacterized protein n=1 Tax=Pseudocohnilembus persalinus TaxID=266149 RepID=A0A0V0QTR2_PSEPJ|nr:hypothetical protein PPERSA_09786 [Pseudocohnilembus persalinus]|eukprot:KRX05646.1 hypothetical protein PPERSA_09786 [Pseudocohnilembus persalinus]
MGNCQFIDPSLKLSIEIQGKQQKFRQKNKITTEVDFKVGELLDDFCIRIKKLYQFTKKYPSYDIEILYTDGNKVVLPYDQTENIQLIKETEQINFKFYSKQNSCRYQLSPIIEHSTFQEIDSEFQNSQGILKELQGSNKIQSLTKI